MRVARAVRYAALLPKLGLGNVWAVAQHRKRLANGYYEQLLPVCEVPSPGPLWLGSASDIVLEAHEASRATILARADEVLNGQFRRFAETRVDEGQHPRWHKGVYAAQAAQHFSRVAVNAVPGEDVKLTWDLSRFTFAPQLALAAAISSGEARAGYLLRLQQLLQHWLAENGYQRGANWACGQEVSVRGFQLMLASLMLRNIGLAPAPQLLEWLSQSWRRVHATLAYAHAQRNNHSLTEHVFLLVAAPFLAQHGKVVGDPSTLAALRAQWPTLLGALILPDGGSAMYSANYHRVFCDMFSHAKLLDDAYGKSDLFAAPMLHTQVANAASLLEALCDPTRGLAPHIGLNDGSLHAVSYADYWNYEPSLLLMSAAFGIPVGAVHARSEHAVWLYGRHAVYRTEATSAPEQWFDAFGLLVISRPAYRAYVKYPRDRFRPSQLDMLHLDLWVNGENVLMDSGTLSYNPPGRTREDGMSGAQAHNTLSLGAAPLVEKLSPFLYARWPNAHLDREGDTITWRVALGGGLTLQRRINFAAQYIQLEDRILGARDWQVNFTGALEESKTSFVAQLGGRASMRFENTQSLSLMDVTVASNYLKPAPAKRLTAKPMQGDKPLVTTIEWVS